MKWQSEVMQDAEVVVPVEDHGEGMVPVVGVVTEGLGDSQNKRRMSCHIVDEVVTLSTKRAGSGL
jgi:hypothetical protein